MAISDTFQDLNVFNGVGVILTIFAVLLFLIFLAYSLTYLKQLSAKIIYLIRVASRVTFQKHKQRQKKKKAKYGIGGAGNDEDDDVQQPKDQFYQELKNNWKKEIYNDRVGRFKSLFYSILVKYNYQLFCCCKVKRFNTLNQYDLLKPNPNFQWMLFAASLGTLWYISVFLTATLHINTQYDARDLADLFFIFYVLVISAVASPCIIFIIWALWRYYNKTVSHAMTTGNEISKQQRQGIYYDFSGAQDSLIGLQEFDLQQNQLEMIEESRNGSINISNNLRQSIANKNRATINFPNNQNQQRFFEEQYGQGSDRMLMNSQKNQKPSSTFHYGGYSNKPINKSSINAVSRSQNLSKIDQEKFPLSRSSRQSRGTYVNYGPFATDRQITPENSVHSIQRNSYNVSQYRNTRKGTNHLRVSQYNNNLNSSHNIMRNSMPSPYMSRSSGKFLQPRRYTTMDRSGKSPSIYAASDNQQAQTLNKIDTGNNILRDNPVPRMKGFYSRLNSPHSCKDATWYGIGAIILFGMTIVACFLCLILQRNLALYVLFLFIGSFLVDMLLVRNIYLFLIAMFHFCFYRQKRNNIQRKYRFRYSEMVRIQQAKNLEYDQAQQGLYRKISGESQEEYNQNTGLMMSKDLRSSVSGRKSTVGNRKGTIGYRKSTVGRKKQSDYLDYPDKLQSVNEQENQDGAGIMASSYGPCGDQKRRAWMTSPDRDDKMKNIKGTQIQARRMTQSRKKKDTIVARKNKPYTRKESDDLQQQEQYDQQQEERNGKDSKIVFATPGAKNGYSPINRLESQEQLTERDGFSKSSPLRILDLMQSKRKNQSGQNLNDGSGPKDSGFSPARHDAKEKWANSPKKKPYYLNKGQLVKVFSPGDGAQSFDHPGDVDDDQLGTDEDEYEKQRPKRRVVELNDDDDNKDGEDKRVKEFNCNKNKKSPQDSRQDGKSLENDQDFTEKVDSENKLHNDGEQLDEDDKSRSENDLAEYGQEGPGSNQLMGSGQPKPKDNDQDSVVDDQQDPQSEKDKLKKKRSQESNNPKNSQEDSKSQLENKGLDSGQEQEDDLEDNNYDASSRHAKSLVTDIARGQGDQSDQDQRTKPRKIANIANTTTKREQRQQDQSEYQKRMENKVVSQGDSDEDSDDVNDNKSLQYSKSGVIAVADDKDLSFDRRSTLPLEEIYGTQNPVNELNDMNLILLDQIYDAFGDGTMEVLKSFKSNHLFLPKEEDDLTEIIQESQIITQQEEDEEQQEEQQEQSDDTEDDGQEDNQQDNKSEPQIRVLNKQPEKLQKEQQVLNQDGLQMLEIIQKLDFWREGDYPLIDDQSPYQLQQFKRQQFSDRPLSPMSQKKALKVDQPQVVQEAEEDEQESQPMFRVQSAEGDQHMLSDQELKLAPPLVLVSDSQEDGQRLDYFSFSTDPFQRSNDQVSSRFGGENRQLPVRLDRLRQSKNSRLVQQGDDNQSELDAVEKLRSDSQLEGSLRMTSERMFRGNVGGEIQIKDGISRPLKDVRQSRHIGPGKDGMQDSSMGVTPMSVRLENEELPIGEEENQQDSKVESSKIQQGLMIDDEQIRNRKKIKPPRLLELTQKERENRPIQGLPMIDCQNQLVDELENNDQKIHDERNQYGEEIQNQMEEDIYLNDGDHLPSELLQANFPTPVPKEHIKHPNSLTKSFYRSKSPYSTKRDTSSKFYQEQQPKSPYNVTKSDFSKQFESSKQDPQQIRSKAEDEDPRSAKSHTKSQLSGPYNQEQQIKSKGDQQDLKSGKIPIKSEFSGPKKQGSLNQDKDKHLIQSDQERDPQNLSRSGFSGNQFQIQSQTGQQAKIIDPKSQKNLKKQGPDDRQQIKSKADQDAKSLKSNTKSELSSPKQFVSSKSPDQDQDPRSIKSPTKSEFSGPKNLAYQKQQIQSQEEDPKSSKSLARSDLSGPKKLAQERQPSQRSKSKGKSDKNLTRSEIQSGKQFGSSKQPRQSDNDKDPKFVKTPSRQDSLGSKKFRSSRPGQQFQNNRDQDPRGDKNQLSGPKNQAQQRHPMQSPENISRSDFSGPITYSTQQGPRKFAINHAEYDQISRNSSIIEHEQVKFAHQVNDVQTSDMDQMQGNQRTQYSRKDPRRQFKSRPKLNLMRQSDGSQFQVDNTDGDNAMLPPRSTGGHFFGSPANRSRYPENFNGRFTTDFKRRHPDDEDYGTKRNNYINETESEGMMKDSPYILPRPGQNRVGSSGSNDPKQLSYPRQMLPNKNPSMTTDSESLAFKMINQAPDQNMMVRTNNQDGFGGPAGHGYYIPRGRSRGMYDSDGENQIVQDRRDSRSYQKSSRGRGSARGSSRGNGGRISDPFNRQYDPQFGGTAFTRITKSKRIGGGYKYESTSLHPPEMSSFDNVPRSARNNISTSQPPVPQQMTTMGDHNSQLRSMPPRHNAKEKIRSLKKMANKSKKKSSMTRSSNNSQKQNMNLGPYEDISVQSKFMQRHYKHEIRGSLRKEKQFRDSVQYEDSPESGQHHHKKRYEPKFPTTTKEAMKQLIQRVPESLKQIKKQQKKRNQNGNQFLINNQAMRKINMYGDDDMKLNVSRMREEHRNSFVTRNDSDLVDDEQNRQYRDKFHPRSTPRKSDDPDTLVLNYNPTSRHLQP